MNELDPARFSVSASEVVFDLRTGSFYTLEEIRFILRLPPRGKVRELQIAVRELLLPELEEQDRERLDPELAAEQRKRSK